MARVLFAWELGKGFGHLAPYLDLVKGLLKKGHQVVFAARDVGNTERIFGNDGVTILQAPIMMHNIGNPYRIQYNLSHLIHNIGFAEIRSLFGLAKAWRHIYHYVRPDLVLFDHSPTALLAARAYPWKRIVSGSGFLIPPSAVPLPMMRYWQEYDQEKLAREEGGLLANMNRVLEILKVPPLKSVAALYDADAHFHLGFKELDHYPQRPPVEYLGMFSPPNHGVAPDWPAGGLKKVFAYLHPYKQIPALLKILGSANFSTIVYAPEVPDAIKKKFQNERMVFSAKPLDVAKVSADCDFAITNGTFGTTAAFLLYGKPVLCIPTNLERVMVTRRVIGLGGGLGVQPTKLDKIKPALRALASSEKYAEAARAFGAGYKDLNLAWQTEKMLATVERLLASAPKQKPAAAAGAEALAPRDPGEAALARQLGAQADTAVSEAPAAPDEAMGGGGEGRSALPEARSPDAAPAHRGSHRRSRKGRHK